MKISKERLKQILNEELAIVEQEQGDAEGDEALANTKSQFGNKLLEVRGLKGLDAKEMQALLELIVDLIELSVSNTAGPTLIRIQQKISQMTGAK